MLTIKIKKRLAIEIVFISILFCVILITKIYVIFYTSSKYENLDKNKLIMDSLNKDFKPKSLPIGKSWTDSTGQVIISNMSTDKSKDLHEWLIHNGFSVPVNLEDFEEFNKTQRKLKALHIFLVKRKISVPESEEDFYKELFPEESLIADKNLKIDSLKKLDKIIKSQADSVGVDWQTKIFIWTTIILFPFRYWIVLTIWALTTIRKKEGQ